MIHAVTYTIDGPEHHETVDGAREAEGTVWVRASEASTEELERVADEFSIHPLSVEDIQGDVRPKTEEYADYTFILIKTAHLRRGETTFDEEIRTHPVGIFVGDDWLVTLSTDGVDAVDTVWTNLDHGNARLLRAGADFAAYRIIDRIVDEYFLLLDDIEDTIEEVEEGILGRPDSDVLVALNTVRRELLSMRKLLWPTRESVGTLARGDPDEIRVATEKYYRDVYDHLVQLVDLTETYRDLAGGARDIYLNTLSLNTNEVMKTLTVVATIILPLTFVVGLYGMNFSGGQYNMPELEWTFGYPAVLLGMAGVTVVLLWYFRRNDWL